MLKAGKWLKGEGMKEIKFRAWDKEQKKIVNVCGIIWEKELGEGEMTKETKEKIKQCLSDFKVYGICEYDTEKQLEWFYLSDSDIDKILEILSGQLENE